MRDKDKVVAEPSACEVQGPLALPTDQDREAELRFLKECLGKKGQEQIRPHCVPVFEVSYSPRQEDRL